MVAPFVVPLMSKVPLLATPAELAMPPVPISCRVPALMVVAPVYVFEPLNLQVPKPVLVKVPVAVPNTEAKVPPWAPPKVRACVVVVVPVLLRLMLPVSPMMVVALPKLTKPP